MKINKTFAAGLAAIALAAGGLGVVGVASAHDEPPPPPGTRPGVVSIIGTPVENIRETPTAPETSDWCSRTGAAPAGEGLADKGGTCLSTPIGEIAKNPVLVNATAPRQIRVGQTLRVHIVVADNLGILDLNAFTKDATGGAGTTFLEHPGELDAAGRPLLHCHIGLTSVTRSGFPSADNNAAFSGVQGFRGDLVAEVRGLPRGSFRGSVWCSQPGHPILPTSVASRVQAFDTFDLTVTGHGRFPHRATQHGR